MKGFVSIPSDDVGHLVKDALEGIQTLRHSNLEKEILVRLKVPRGRTWVDVLFHRPVTFPTREEVLSNLKAPRKYFGSVYDQYMEGYSNLVQDLHALRKATLLVTGDVLVSIELAQHLQTFKETE